MTNNTGMFRRYTPIFVCAYCGKRTHESDTGSSDFCPKCFRSMQLENEHNDSGHRVKVKGCPEC